jgi:arylsulfatase
MEQKVVSTELIPSGTDRILSSRRWARGQIKTQSGKFSIAGEGLCVGRDGGEPVTDDYPGEAPWAFTGGTI